VRGIKGLENQYNDLLNSYSNGLLRGERDVLSDIAFNKQSIMKPKKDGANLVLNISLKLQKNIEMILDKYKEELLADELIATIMDSETGKIIAMASSNRFNPDFIRQEEMSSLNVRAIESVFEPGSVLKPITMAIVLENKKVDLNELLFAYNEGKKNKRGEYKRGSYKLGKYRLRDDHQFKKNYISIEDVIVYSSNIGTLQLAQRLSADQFVDGLENFGMTKKTGIDLPFEKTGTLPPRYRFRVGEDKGEDNIFKATVSYGQGMLATFMQILKAYSVFNNNGFIVTPQIIDYLEARNGKHLKVPTDKPRQIISTNTANEVKEMLIKTVQRGTGSLTYIDGLEIGGKTGTAQIARGGKYQKEYISSFFGFVNGENKKYTIGVTTFNPVGRKWWHHYASHSAVRPFKEIVETMLTLGYLKKENK
ncbi:MAG: penicillin-binding protein 2, partial [Sphaerochaetaceae bacterium]|nr:penicillin-binding protein 2 [Sphaerochaetaceae bacterium]